jgi:ArsR family transcriptional regulator
MRKLTKKFKALSDPNRIRILKMLEIRPLCLCEIRSVLGLANSTVSKHLSILRDAEFILDRKEGRWVYFKLNRNENEEYISELLFLMEKWCQKEKIILNDRKNVVSVDRETICSI